MWRWLVAFLTWAQLQLIEPVVRWWEEVVLGSWEEWLLALVRQGFEETTRFLNGLGAWFLSLFNQHSYREQLRRAWQENSWQQWWGEVSTRPSTLNALVADLVAQRQQQQEQQQSQGTQQQERPQQVHHRERPEPITGSASSGQPGPSNKAVPAAPIPSGNGQSLRGGASWWPRQQRDSSKRLGRARLPGGQSLNGRVERPVVFVQQSGMGILDELAKRRHGLIEDAKMAAQLAVSRAFELARTSVRAVLFLPSRESMASHQWGISRRGAAPPADGDASGAGRLRHEGPQSTGSTGSGRPAAHKLPALQRSKSAHVNIAELAYKPGAGAGAASSNMARRGLRRSRSYGRLSSGAAAFGHVHLAEAPSDALSVIRAAGYPHELHTVTTADGYVLRLERIPRPAARDVVFFMHGVLDTSMAWVSGGVTGSQAFAAWEAGFDVWLGNSRGNAPRQHQGSEPMSRTGAYWSLSPRRRNGRISKHIPADPASRGRRYWQYNINHMGMYDIAAQLDHIHNTKCAELGAGTVTLDLDHLGPLAGSFLGEKAGGAAAAAGPGAALAGGRLLPGRAASTCAAQPLYGQSRMRHSNSDGNLYRWGSTGSNNSDRAGRAAAAQQQEPGVAPRPTSPAPDAAARIAVARTSTGPCTGDHGSDLAEASQPCSPSTPQPGRPGRSLTPSVSISAASLGRSASGQEPLSPTASCDGRGGASAPEGYGSVAGEHHEHLVKARSAGGAADHAPIGACDGVFKAGARERHQAHQQQQQHLLRGEAPAGPGVAADAALRAMSPSVLSAASSARSAPPGPHPVVHSAPVRHNAVTLTVMSPRPEPSLSYLSSAELDRAAAGWPPPLPTTFTLEAKTRTDFRGTAPATGPEGGAAQHGGAAGAAGTAAPGPGPGTGGAAGSGSGGRRGSLQGGHAAEADSELQAGPAVAGAGGSTVGSAAASVLDAMGSVLGPAADAVTTAVATAAATAGAAFATAAHSASQLLQPPLAVATGLASRHHAGSAFASQTSSKEGSAAAAAAAAGAAAAAASASGSAAPHEMDVEERGGTETATTTSAAGSLPQQPSAQPDRPGAKASPVNQPDAAQVLPQHAARPADRQTGGVPRTVTSPHPATASTTLSPPPAAHLTAGLSPTAATASFAAPFRRVHSTDQLSTAHHHFLANGGSSTAPTGLSRSAFASAAALAAPDRLSSGPLTRPGSGDAGGRGLGLGLGSGGSGGGLMGGPLPHPQQLLPGGAGDASDGVWTGGAARQAPRDGGTGAAPPPAPPPYKLRCVAHSLGGMSMLIHLVNRLREGRPHHVSRLLLLTPAGFHKYCPKAARPIMWTMPFITRVLRALFGRHFSFPLYIPTSLARGLTFKLLLSASRIPGLGELLRTCYKAMLDGDISQWDRALQMPHYSAEDMPAISVDQVLHLVQLVAADAFRLYDYGSPAANTAHYGCPTPPDVASEYWRLDLPVHLVAGSRDGIIPPPNVLRHYEAMRAQGVAVSYREFDFGHLDFTFGVKEELRMYLMKVLTCRTRTERERAAAGRPEGR